MTFFIEHPAQNRIRQFGAAPDEEIIIEINARFVHGNNGMTQRELQEVAAEALLGVLRTATNEK